MRINPPQLVGLLLGFALVALVSLGTLKAVQPTSQLAIGCKNFTESRFLANLLATAIRERSGLQCRVRELASTSLCYDALQAGAIDLYPEYTGTMLVEIYKQPSLSDPKETFERAGTLAQEHQLVIGNAFGFNNTYVMATNQQTAARLHLEKVSQLAQHPELTAGFPSEFMQRPDGYPGLEKTYGLHFSRPPVDLAPGHMYAAVARGQVDIISAYSTDGRIDQFQLVTLEDDRHFFPSYEAVTLLREQTVQSYPQLEPILGSLEGCLDEQVMRKINADIDLHAVPVRQAAETFWKTQTAPRT